MIFKKNEKQIEAMKKAGELSARVLREISYIIKPGVSTLEIDELAESIIRLAGGVPAFSLPQFAFHFS